MQKVLNLSQSLLNFDGTPIIEQEKEIMLKSVLIGYILRSSQMGLSDEDQMTLHILGFSLGKDSNSITLSSKEYDALKRMTDNGKVKNPQGIEEPLYTNLVRFQVKEMVDKAAVVNQSPESTN